MVLNDMANLIKVKDSVFDLSKIKVLQNKKMEYVVGIVVDGVVLEVGDVVKTMSQAIVIYKEVRNTLIQYLTEYVKEYDIENDLIKVIRFRGAIL
jgi:hypothetical protein